MGLHRTPEREKYTPINKIEKPYAIYDNMPLYIKHRENLRCANERQPVY